jgi:hypothetical protein
MEIDVRREATRRSRSSVKARGSKAIQRTHFLGNLFLLKEK